MSSFSSDKRIEPISVVGIAFQFPGGADTEEKFWNMLMNRQCVSREFPTNRGNIDMHYDPTHLGTSKVLSYPIS
jgi:acyl transferase domain-containing protein